MYVDKLKFEHQPLNVFKMVKLNLGFNIRSEFAFRVFVLCITDLDF